MTVIARSPAPKPVCAANLANVMALGLTHAESALHALTAGQVDAIVDPQGNTYLLRPAQEYLRRNEARLQGLFDRNPDVITVLSESGEVRYQNSAVTRMLGYDVGALVGLRIINFVHPDDLLVLCQAFSEVREGSLPSMTFEFRHRTFDGSWCPLEATLARLQPMDAGGLILTFRDMTDRQRAQQEAASREEALTGASHAKDLILATLSHELRTPLMPALLGMKALLEDERFAEARPTLAMIQRNIELQSQLLEELIDFITVGQQKVRVRSDRIDAHESVRYVLEICQGEIAAAKINVETDLRASESMVLADSLKLQQVMWNLLKNAIKFSAPGASIWISSMNDATGRIALQFVDQGIGIEPELVPLVFDPIQQDDPSMQHVHGGLGLGMFIAKGLAEAQQGTLTVESGGRGQGATFCLSFKTVPKTGGQL